MGPRNDNFRMKSQVLFTVVAGDKKNVEELLLIGENIINKKVHPIPLLLYPQTSSATLLNYSAVSRDIIMDLCVSAEYARSNAVQRASSEEQARRGRIWVEFLKHIDVGWEDFMYEFDNYQRINLL